MKYSRTKDFCSHRSSSSGSLPCLLRQVQMYASIANPLVRCWVLVFQLSATSNLALSALVSLLCFPPFSFNNRSYSSESPLGVCPIYLLCLLLIVCNRNLSSPIIASTFSFPIGAIHLWRPHGGGQRSGSGGRMWTGEGVQPHVDVHTEN